MLTHLLAGDGKEAMGPIYLREMIKAVQATMGKCLHSIRSVIVVLLLLHRN